MNEKPTWEDMGVPLELVNSIKTLPPCYLLDSLVYQLVYRHNRKPVFSFQCMRCSAIHRPERSSEDITECEQCGNTTLRCSGTMRWSREVPSYSRKNGSGSLESLITKMYDNYDDYFVFTGRHKGSFRDWLDCGWNTHNFNLYAQFIGGEKVETTSPRLCIIKAAILCPYLWDTKFDWNGNENQDTIRPISPILHNYCHNGWIGKPE